MTARNNKSFQCRGTGPRIRPLVCHNDRRVTQLSNQHGPSCCMPNLVRTDFTQYQEHVIKTDRLECADRAPTEEEECNGNCWIEKERQYYEQLRTEVTQVVTANKMLIYSKVKLSS
jgi:hypothetical protein